MRHLRGISKGGFKVFFFRIKEEVVQWGSSKDLSRSSISSFKGKIRRAGWGKCIELIL